MAFPNYPDAAMVSTNPTSFLQVTDATTVDLNVTNGITTLFSNPTASGRVFYVTDIIIYDPSTSLTTASISIGQNSTSWNDILANATHTGLDGATKYKVLVPVAAASVEVAAGGNVKIKVNTAQGAAATAKFRLVGFFV